MEDLTFKFIENPTQDELDFLTEKINQETPERGWACPFAIFAYTIENRIIAGCDGAIIYGVIHTDQLWVDPEFRGQGLGEKILQKVHHFGKEKGCSHATVLTMDFQAPDFYKKLGYQVDFIRKGMHLNGDAIYLSKKI
jgi:ribosomal protein S18 acetylase RimI-like enzyme